MPTTSKTLDAFAFDGGEKKKKKKKMPPRGMVDLKAPTRISIHHDNKL